MEENKPEILKVSFSKLGDGSACCYFPTWAAEAGLVYRSSPRKAKVTVRNPVSKKKSFFWHFNYY